jgi:hypothetical protein
MGYYTAVPNDNDDTTVAFEEESSEEDDGQSQALTEDIKEVAKTPDELFGGRHEKVAAGHRRPVPCRATIKALRNVAYG